MRILQLDDVAPVTVPFGDPPMSLLALIDGWCGRVLQLRHEALDPDVDPDRAWGPYDLIGAYHGRDALADYLRDQSRDGEDAILRPVVVADELLRGFTEEDAHGSLRQWGPVAPVERWWWRRIPREGPIAAELRR